MIPTHKLDLWIKSGFNVELIGRHGVGKTSIVLDAWKRHGLNYLYFSAANMDPWIDLVGVPRENAPIPKEFQVIGELIDIDEYLAHDWIRKNWHMDDTQASRILGHVKQKKFNPQYLELIRPKALAYDEVDAIFFDEYNRAPEKVRNATMQFIQFKEVNGKKFNRLKMIWTAVNPDNGDYDVQKMDPAQEDRFEIHYSLPFRPDDEYFKNKYDTIGTKFVSWWNKLPDEIRNNISPRRLEYAIKMFLCNGDLADVLPKGTNLDELRSVLNHGTVDEKLAALMGNPHTTPGDIRRFIENDNNFQHLKPVLLDPKPENDKVFRYFAPYFEKERVLSITSNDFRLIDRFVHNAGNNPETVEILKKHSEKAGVIGALFSGLIMREFDCKQAATQITKEDSQKELFNHILSKLNSVGLDDPNKVYGAAYVYENAVGKWPSIAKEKYAEELRQLALTGLKKHNLEKYFKL